MIVAGRHFQPTKTAILIALAGVAIFSSLGYWQLMRADYKQSIQDKFEQRLSQDYQQIDVEKILIDPEYRKVSLSGNFDHQRIYLLDNQVNRGRVGYQIVSAFNLAESDRVILVNRGWVEAASRREQLPQIKRPLQLDQVSGILSYPSQPAIKLGELAMADQSPQVIPYIDIEFLQNQHNGRLLPVILWLAPEQPGSYIRAWNPLWRPPEKSQAYATQWFAFAGITLVLLIVLNLRKIDE